MDDIFKKSIVLVGGMAIGKSTVAQQLNEITNMPIISTDAIRCEILESIPDYSFEKQLQIRSENGFKGEMEYLKPYSNVAINKVIDGLSTPSIIDLGAIFPNQLNDELIKKIKMFKNVILLYSNNNSEILKRRSIKHNSELEKIYMQTLDESLYEPIATKKINVDNMSKDDIINEIVSNSIIR